MTIGFRVIPALTIAALALAPAPGAAELKTPSCEAYLVWAKAYDKKDRWRLNSTNKRFTLPAIFRAAEVEALFGQPALAWSLDDVGSASEQAKACGRDARKAKRGADQRVFRNIQISLNQGLKGALVQIDRAREELEQNWQALVALPPSKHGLRAFGALRRMEPGGALDPEYWQILAHNANIPDYKHAQFVVVALRKMPDAASESLRAMIDERYQAMRAPVVDALRQELTASPDTIEGLHALQAAVTTTREELGPALTDADYAAIDQTASERRQAIEEKLLTEQVAAIEAAAETLDGLDSINKILARPVAAALTEPNAGTLQSTGLKRREAIGTALVDAEIAKLSEIPGSLDGLHQLQAFESQVLGTLDERKTGLTLTPFSHAVVDRFATLGREAYGDYEDALDALPENEQGLRELHAFVARNKSVVQRIRRSTREQYEQASAARFETIQAAVAREHARLAALPLPGAVFADSHGPRFEFRDRSRVYLVMSKQMTVEGEYEEDGDRLVIRTPQGNMVFDRDGIWLKGMGLELKRQAAP